MNDKIYVSDNGQKRQATAEEIAQMEKDRADFEEQERLIEAEQQAKEAARQSAIDKLKKLGLNEEEIAALVP